MEVVDQGPEDSALARAIVELAEALRLTTVAEGIETPAQAEIVRQMGCGLGQGYLYAAPLDALSVEKLLSVEHELAGGALAAAEPPEVS